jgi:ABC-2 type transport system permease protein
MIRKEFRQIARDRITLLTAVYLPLVMLFLFGYAISMDVRNISVAVYDQDRSQLSAELVESFQSSRYFTIAQRLDALDDIDRVLDSGSAALVLAIPPEFSSRVHSRKEAAVHLFVDGTFSARALIVSNYATAVVQERAAAIAASSLTDFGLSGATPVEAQTRIWYNPEMTSENYVVPGLFAVLLMAIPPMLTALAIVREKETGTIQQIYASPLTPLVFIAGKIIPYSVVAFGQMLLVLAAGILWFGIPFKGSLTLLILTSIIYVSSTVSIGLFVSTITRTQLAATLLSLIVTLMPSFLFSGFLFPLSSMPYVLSSYTYFFPVRYFNEISRDIVLKGVGLEYIWINAGLLLVYAAILITLASLRTRKKVA